MNSSENWRVHIDSTVYKTLAKLPRQDAQRVTRILESLAANPYAGDIIKLGGLETMWRRRVGSYRVFYEIIPHEHRIQVSAVRRRASNTY